MSRCTKKNCPMVGVSADCDLKDCLYRTEADQSKDTIYRADAIKATWQEPTYTDPLNVLTEVRDRIEAIPSADRPQGWIPCSERLPDDNREVLISLEWGIDIGTYERGEWRSEWINHYDDDNVLAWMPLPPAYEGKGADDE